MDIFPAFFITSDECVPLDRKGIAFKFPSSDKRTPFSGKPFDVFGFPD
jgi:hypothetical protein